MTPLLIVANVVVFVAELFAGDALIRAFALWPPGALAPGAQGAFLPWQMLTYAFVHANGAHLALNMLGLYMFGRDVERVLGAGRMLLLYLSSVLSAAAAAGQAHAAGPRDSGVSGDRYGYVFRADGSRRH